MKQTGKMLKKYGASVHFGRDISERVYLGIRLGMVTLGVLIGVMADSLPLAVGFGIGFFWLPDFVLYRLNKSDNRKMIGDIRTLYHSLEMQIRAGVYVLDALGDSHHGITNKRLSRALRELGTDILLAGSGKEALNAFREKFDNRQIDSLCIILMQSLETGKAVELIRDLSEQVRDMEREEHRRKKQNLDRAVTFYQLGILMAMIGILLYGCVMGLFQSQILF